MGRWCIGQLTASFLFWAVFWCFFQHEVLFCWLFLWCWGLNSRPHTCWPWLYRWATSPAQMKSVYKIPVKTNSTGWSKGNCHLFTFSRSWFVCSGRLDGISNLLPVSIWTKINLGYNLEAPQEYPILPLCLLVDLRLSVKDHVVFLYPDHVPCTQSISLRGWRGHHLLSLASKDKRINLFFSRVAVTILLIMSVLVSFFCLGKNWFLKIHLSSSFYPSLFFHLSFLPSTICFTVFME